MKARLEKLKNKPFAFECMDLLKKNRVSMEDIWKLTDANYCKTHFNAVKPILKQIGNVASQSEIYDNTAQPRFYGEVWQYQNHNFLITNYWYGPNTNHIDNRTPFLIWVLAHCG